MMFLLCAMMFSGIVGVAISNIELTILASAGVISSIILISDSETEKAIDRLTEAIVKTITDSKE